ncbi:MAG: hypothetical protein CL885_00860 [Dehalococcoidia bacterium]|nr:hypothetical protein [Dehalococcoidia bacterium]
MKEYEFVVDAGVMTYFVKAESEDEARKILADDGGLDIIHTDWHSPTRKDFLEAELNYIHHVEEEKND